MKLELFFAFIKEYLFPQGCALCEKPITEPLAAFYCLCNQCRDSLALPKPGRGRCVCCGQPLISETDKCITCRNNPDRCFDYVLPLFPFMGKYKKILSAYKFGRRFGLGHFYIRAIKQGSEILEKKIRDYGNGNEKDFNPIWVPVPPRPGKIKKRLWDQIDYLASLLEKNNFSVKRCLKRLASKSQKGLNLKERRINLRNKIVVPKDVKIPKTAILFDDVYTTGSTMETCAAALKKGGAEKVYGLCLCYD